MTISPEVLELGTRVSNWGRWGDDDQLGCGNLLTDASAARGVACATTGQRLSLAVDLREDGIQVGQPAGRFNPILTFTSLNERDQFATGIWTSTDDLVVMSACAGTHIAALCHVGRRFARAGVAVVGRRLGPAVARAPLVRSAICWRM